MLEGPAIRNGLRCVGDEWGVLDLALAVRSGNLMIVLLYLFWLWLKLGYLAHCRVTYF